MACNGDLWIPSFQLGHVVSGSRPPTRLRSADWNQDATIFHNLEAWIASPSEPSTTLYLNLIEVFQRHVTATAFKLAGGVDRASVLSRGTKQNAIAPAFTTKITKAVFDAMYALLDGFVHLASSDSPVVTKATATLRDPEKGRVSDSSVISGTNKLQLVDLTDGVCVHVQSLRHGMSFVTVASGYTAVARHIESSIPSRNPHPEHVEPNRDLVWRCSA